MEEGEPQKDAAAQEGGPEAPGSKAYSTLEADFEEASACSAAPSAGPPPCPPPLVANHPPAAAAAAGQVLTELATDAGLDKFRVEYEKVFRALKKSHGAWSRAAQRGGSAAGWAAKQAGRALAPQLQRAVTQNMSVYPPHKKEKDRVRRREREAADPEVSRAQLGDCGGRGQGAVGAQAVRGRPGGRAPRGSWAAPRLQAKEGLA